MKNNQTKQCRRDFIIKSLSSCAMCCLAATPLKSISFDNKNVSDDKHKFLTDSGMTVQDVYNFAFKWWYIPAMKNLMDQIGKEKFIENLKNSSNKIHENDNKFWEQKYPNRDMRTWIKHIKKTSEHMKNYISFKVIKEEVHEFEIIYTECLWAKTFKEARAEEIGYAGVCYQDYSLTKSFNSNFVLIREKTLMQGHDSCHFRWIVQD